MAFSVVKLQSKYDTMSIYVAISTFLKRCVSPLSFEANAQCQGQMCVLDKAKMQFHYLGLLVG